MGLGIAQAAASSGFDILLYDVSDELLKKALERISNNLKKSIDKKILTSEQATAITPRIHPKTSLQLLG